MALVDNFDSYSTGDLNGQGSWSGSTLFDVVASDPQTSPNCVQYTSNSSNSITKSITTGATGSQVFYMKINDAAGDNRRYAVYLDGAGGGQAWIRISDQNKSGDKFCLVVTGGSEASLGSKSTAWRKIEVEWDANVDQFRARVDDGSWTSWLTSSTGFSSISSITIASENAGQVGADCFWDSFQEPTSGPTNLKSLDTNVKSNIKSYNTNVIANIKSINTNA